MAETMIERVARAILAGHDWTQNSERQENGWDSVPPDWQEAYRSMARAAIEAMMEPTEAMLEAGPPEPYMDAAVWSKMIDAALVRPDHKE